MKIVAPICEGKIQKHSTAKYSGAHNWAEWFASCNTLILVFLSLKKVPVSSRLFSTSNSEKFQKEREDCLELCKL